MKRLLLPFLAIALPIVVLDQTAENNYNAAKTCMRRIVEYGESPQQAFEMCDRSVDNDAWPFPQ